MVSLLWSLSMPNTIQYVDMPAAFIALPIVVRCDGPCIGDSRLH